MTPSFNQVAVTTRVRSVVRDHGGVVEVAKCCGIKRNTLDHVIRADNLPSLTTLASLCAGLQIDADWFLFGGKSK